jgi:hypothetical protein
LVPYALPDALNFQFSARLQGVVFKPIQSINQPKPKLEHRRGVKAAVDLKTIPFKTHET